MTCLPSCPRMWHSRLGPHLEQVRAVAPMMTALELQKSFDGIVLKPPLARAVMWHDSCWEQCLVAYAQLRFRSAQGFPLHLKFGSPRRDSPADCRLATHDGRLRLFRPAPVNSSTRGLGSWSEGANSCACSFDDLPVLIAKNTPSLRLHEPM